MDFTVLAPPIIREYFTRWIMRRDRARRLPPSRYQIELAGHGCYHIVDTSTSPSTIVRDRRGDPRFFTSRAGARKAITRLRRGYR